MKKAARKMTLNRDTLRHLNAQALTNVAAAASLSCRAVCPIDTPPHTKAECA
jgi:hypothetical protein